jgi:hypothetical protein
MADGTTPNVRLRHFSHLDGCLHTRLYTHLLERALGSITDMETTLKYACVSVFVCVCMCVCECVCVCTCVCACLPTLVCAYVHA